MSEYVAPSCPACDEPLEMLRQYAFAPSIAMCGRCGAIYDVEFDYDLGEWVPTPASMA